MDARIRITSRYLGHVAVDLEATYRRNELRTRLSLSRQGRSVRELPGGMNSHLDHRPVRSTRLSDSAEYLPVNRLARLPCASSSSTRQLARVYRSPGCVSARSGGCTEGHSVDEAGSVTAGSVSRASSAGVRHRSCRPIFSLIANTSRPFARGRSLLDAPDSSQSLNCSTQ